MAKIDRLLLCTCARSMQIDAVTAEAATKAVSVLMSDRLCTADAELALKAFGQDGTTLIACGQQAALFQDLFEEAEGPGALRIADIRDRAGWSDDATAYPKQAALLAESALDRPATPTKDIESQGVCLVLGTGAAALHAAARLADRLAVTCLLGTAPDDLEPPATYDVALGTIRTVTGALAGFEVVVDGYARLDPAGRGGAAFEPPVNGAKSRCDIILDLRGEPALFPASHKRDGYVRADPRNPADVERAVARAADLQGAFEKPLYIRFDAAICAHTRANQTGCERCLGVCPTGAITPAGEHVAIDPDICAGCGSCAAVCPSGAASYDDPPVSFLFTRLATLASAYRRAGGSNPRVLFHDAAFGVEMIRLGARFGRGLPADVLPVEVETVEGIGHAEILAAVGVGFAAAYILAGPQAERGVIDGQIALAGAILAGTGQDAKRIALLDPANPDALADALYGTAPAPLAIKPILPMGSRREVTRLAASALAAGRNTNQPNDAPRCLPLPAGAPYGAVEIDGEACTLCLACVSLCPVGALGDNPDKPQVRFQETACLQCGICRSTCPEDAISLTPRLNLGETALSFAVLNQEEPFNCIECGKPFGVKSTIERVVATLEGKHWMFTNSDNAKLIQMCDDCRVGAQYHAENSPFAMGDRPATRTTDDYLAERKKPE